MNVFFWIIGLFLVIAIYSQIKDSKDRKKFNKDNAAPAWFDPALYLSLNADVQAAGVDAWNHYNPDGRREKRAPYFGVDAAVAVNNKKRLILDTDSATESDPDDVQCYIAQASSLESLFNVRGIVSTAWSEWSSGVAFIKSWLAKLNAVSPLYKIYDVYQNQEAIEFYKREIDSAYADSIPLEIHVWGSVTTLSKALAGREQNLGNVTLYWVASSNRTAVPEYREAWERLKPFTSKFKAFYRDEQGFRGIMRSGNIGKLEGLHQAILASPVGSVYAQYPIPEPTYNWKSGDLSLYFYSINPALRDQVFKRDQYGFVADGQASENMVASDGFRDEMIRIVTENVNRV